MSNPQKKYSEIISDLMSYPRWAQHDKYWTNLLASDALTPRRLVVFVLRLNEKYPGRGYPFSLARDKPHPLLFAMIKSERLLEYLQNVPTLKTKEFGMIFFEFFLNSNPFSTRTKYSYKINVYRHFEKYIFWPGLLHHLAATNNGLFSSFSSVIQTYYLEIFAIQSFYSKDDVFKLIDIFWEAIAFGIQFPFDYLQESIENNTSVFGKDIVNRFYPVVYEYFTNKKLHPQLDKLKTQYGSTHIKDFMKLLKSDDGLVLYCVSQPF